MTRPHWRNPLKSRRRDEGGYVAILTVMIFVTLFGMCAFAVDVGNWYHTGQQEQAAADAAALSGVPNLPSNQAAAFADVQKYAKANGFDGALSTVDVIPSIDGQPTRLRVTISKTVTNTFGQLFGIGHTTIVRTAVADYAGPVPMGSPCNEYGNDPDATSGVRGTTCAGVTGQFWASVNSPNSAKSNGDAYQSTGCVAGVDGCSGTTNTDYAADGYFYTVHVPASAAGENLTIQAFDGAFVNVGLTCTDGNFGSGTTEARDALNPWVLDESTRYADTATSAFCTGDNAYGGSGAMNTQFTVRAPSAAPWDPLTFPPLSGCQKTYAGYDGNLFPALNSTSGGYRSDIAQSFRRWDTLCTIPSAVPGDYLVQVKTNGLGTDSTNQGNRFSLRAFSTTQPTAKDTVSVSGREKMAMFSNKPGATTEFYLARVQSGAHGQLLQIKLFDIGDSNLDGTIQLVKPPDATGDAFTNCTGSGVKVGNLPTCSFTVNAGSPSPFNGKWQTVQIPIPANYACADADTSKCWVRLKYVYGTGSAPTDVTSWSANLFGDPVRLVE